MRYKIVVTCPKLETAEKVYELLHKSKVYNSSEIIHLHPIKEICDECLKKEYGDADAKFVQEEEGKGNV